MNLTNLNMLNLVPSSVTVVFVAITRLISESISLDMKKELKSDWL